MYQSWLWWVWFFYHASKNEIQVRKSRKKKYWQFSLLWKKVSSLSLQQLAEPWVGWECDVFVFLNTKILCLFLSHSSVLQLLFVHCRLTESKDVGAKEESAQVRLCQEEATLQKYIIPFCSLNLLFHKCWWVWCVSLLVSVLWSRGETALHKAACQRHRAICQLLVDAGASLRKTDSKGKTPRDRAQQAGDPDLASYLESRQNYQMVPHEDLETAVWCLKTEKRIFRNSKAAPEHLGIVWGRSWWNQHVSRSRGKYQRTCHQFLRATESCHGTVRFHRLAHDGGGGTLKGLWNPRATEIYLNCFQQVAWTSPMFICKIY